MNTEKITVVRHYGDSVYQGDKLVGHFDTPSGLTAFHLAQILGVPFEVRSESWEEMPGRMAGKRTADEFAPESLADLRSHFEALQAKKKADRVAALKTELARLGGE